MASKHNLGALYPSIPQLILEVISGNYEVCSNSIWIGFVVVVHWVGCVCNQPWHFRTCLSNSWNKLQVAAFAQLAAVGRGSYTCAYVIAIFYDVWKYRTTHLHQVSFSNWKNRNGSVSIIAASIQWRCNGSYTSVSLVPSIKEGRTSVESDPRSGRPSTLRNEEMIAKFRTIVRSNRILTVQETGDECGIPVGSCDAILTDDLHMKRVCAKFMPRLLTDDQCEQRQTITRDLFERSCEDVKSLKNTATGDESWVYRYDPKTKQQSSQ